MCWCHPSCCAAFHQNRSCEKLLVTHTCHDVPFDWMSFPSSNVAIWGPSCLYPAPAEYPENRHTHMQLLTLRGSLPFVPPSIVLPAKQNIHRMMKSANQKALTIFHLVHCSSGFSNSLSILCYHPAPVRNPVGKPGWMMPLSSIIALQSYTGCAAIGNV